MLTRHPEGGGSFLYLELHEVAFAERERQPSCVTDPEGDDNCLFG